MLALFISFKQWLIKIYSKLFGKVKQVISPLKYMQYTLLMLSGHFKCALLVSELSQSFRYMLLQAHISCVISALHSQALNEEDI